MATKMTANGVSTTTTPGTEQYEVFFTGYRTRRKKHYQMITAIQVENCSPVCVPRSKSADNAVMNGSTRNNDISQVVI